MRRSSLTTALVATLLAGNAAAATDPMAHVRGLNAEGRELIATASARSTVVHTLVNALQATDVVVYVTVEPLPGYRRTGYLSFLTAGGGLRYVVVKLDSFMHPRELAAMLGHELQHALEVASAPEVCDTKTLATLYERIGWRSGSGKWETELARATGERVTLELSGFRFPAPMVGMSGPMTNESSRPQANRRR